MKAAFTTTCTQDGIWIARCSATGVTATGRTIDEAVAELCRMLAASEAA